jgi:hypothetical protein
MYLHEIVFGDPAEPYRREGLVLAARLEDGIIACSPATSTSVPPTWRRWRA